MILAVSVAGHSCKDEIRTPGALLDMLARKPDDSTGSASVQVSLDGRLVRLRPGAEVRYRIEPRTESEVRLKARAAGAGRLEAGWFTIDRTTGAASPGKQWEIEGAWPAEVAHAFPLSSDEDLLELRLAWRAPQGGAEIELLALGLQESELVERPSIVLIAIDTLSARHLSTYGYPLETDPELARLAAESFVFENCFSNAPWTVPSFMTLMTGLYSRSHELTSGGSELWERWFLAPNRWTLAESLRAAGYRTAGFVDTTWIAEKFGFVQGFDAFDATAAFDSFDAIDNPDGGIRKTAGMARAFLERLEPGASSFVFVHAFDVHGPYTVKPPEGARARGTEPYDMEHSAPAGGSTWTYGIVPTYIARGEVPAGELPSPMHTGPIVKAYDEGIRFVDGELGKLFAFLREAGILERSWVVVTADHGETMADASLLFGHSLLNQDVVHVPLIMRPPGGCPGKRIPEAVQLADLYPTLTELAGISGHGSTLHGRSLVPLLQDESRASSIVLAETGVSEQAMLVADGWKLIELEPARSSPQEAWISHPLLARNLPSLVELEAYAATGKGRSLDWLDDVELRRDVFERLPADGLTEELLSQMEARKGFPRFLEFVKHKLKGPFYELYDLRADPEAKHDVAVKHPDKLASMKKLLRQEQQRRTDAAKLALPPAKPVEMPPEEIRALEGLGYGGGGAEE